MQQSSQYDISKIKGFVKRRWKWFAVPFVTLLIGTVIATLEWPKRYTATCIIDIGTTEEEKEVDREIHRYGSLRETNAKDKFEALRTEMLSDQRLYELLVGGGKTVQRIGELADSIHPEDQVAVAKEVVKMRKRFSTELQAAKYIHVRYSGRTSHIAQLVLNELFGAFQTERKSREMEAYLNMKRTHIGVREGFEADIRKAEEELREFQERNTLKLVVKDPDFIIKRQQETESRLAEIAAELQAKESRLHFLVERLEETREKLERQATYPRKTARRIKFENAIAELEIQYVMLKDQYTDEHPRMVTLQEQINKLKEEMDKEPPEEADPTKDPDLDNPKYAEYRDEKNKTELEIEQLKAERDAKQKLIISLKENIETIPRFMEEERKRNRAIDMRKDELARAILEQSEGEKREELAGRDRINAYRLVRIEPARIPDRSIWQQVFAAGVFITIVISVGLVAMIELTDQSLKTVDEARDVLELPSLGIVPLIVTSKDSRHRWIVRGIWGGSLLVLICGAIVFCLLYEPAGEWVINALNRLIADFRELNPI